MGELILPGQPEPVVNPFGTVARLQRIANIGYPAEIKMHCTSTLWERLVAELRSLGPGAFMDPSKMPTPENFKSMKISTTTFVNSGTADQKYVDALNAGEERKATWREKHDRLAMRAGEKKPAIEYVDAASTHDDTDLRREIADRVDKSMQRGEDITGISRKTQAR